ncbi:hypothetical protein [Halosimplex pelagicum]|uniref:Uncharacterized protein n=1 Tax=Halosimplex pelagicum TaxID=869886 RepID=A0A7D5T350_9EURY|nr:hypothetical protein [Halosimplex pelagicum]QLH80448.1 hypothetical protein HZS54_01845 [Halosimplex pelagicum]
MPDAPTDRGAAADRPVDDAAGGAEPTDATAASEAAFDVAPELFGAAPADSGVREDPRRPDDTAL